MSAKKKAECELCGSGYSITFHHLIPKSCHANKWFKKHFDKKQMRTDGIYICRSCHSFIHKQFTEKLLGRELNTLEKICANRKVATYLEWAKKRVQ